MTTADAIVSAFVDDGERIAPAIEGAVFRIRGDVALFITGVPVPVLNSVVTTRSTARAEDVAYLLDQIAEAGLPFSLQVRPGCSKEVLELARARGMVQEDAVPLMAVERAGASVSKAADHPELAIRVLSAEEAGLHAAVASEGFEEDVETFRRISPPSLLMVPGYRAYVGFVGDQPVTTGIGATHLDHVGIFNVATPRRHRGRGYGAAITARAVADGFDSGASFAYLQSSPMGLKVYESLGFRTLETWSVWVSGQSHS